MLLGCHVEDSGFSNGAFTVHAFVQPLYVPAETVVLSFGRRLGLGQERWWDLDSQPEADAAADALELIRLQALPLFERLSTPADFARRAAELGPAENEHRLEATAYSQILAGDHPAADGLLARLVTKVRRSMSDIPWAVEMAARAQSLRGDLQTDPAAAVTRLQAWRADTLRRLRLPDTSAGTPAPLSAGDG